MPKRLLAEIIEGEFLIDLAIHDLKLGGYSKEAIYDVFGGCVGKTRIQSQVMFRKRLREWQLGITAAFHPDRGSFDYMVGRVDYANRQSRKHSQAVERSRKSDRYQVAKTCRANGWTYAEIAERFGVSRQAIWQLLRPVRKKRAPEPEEDVSIPEWKRKLMELTSGED